MLGLAGLLYQRSSVMLGIVGLLYQCFYVTLGLLYRSRPPLSLSVDGELKCGEGRPPSSLSVDLALSRPPLSSYIALYQSQMWLGV
jgi:hypothetical protein